ncbi:hypothetical protein C5Y97_08200 [Blastopirellula marina]|uniref:Uncharacterized protein n=1 Tax=Blastopirellula marina TaxID=124 RepID=A0A2S8G0U4_9BACT|nr:hypothetical protein C5Y98_08200 [Blastopirellula marina]PTL44712.1 hypothetical protein C5Y97_08200 [Blastopirellula marina]
MTPASNRQNIRSNSNQAKSGAEDNHERGKSLVYLELGKYKILSPSNAPRFFAIQIACERMERQGSVRQQIFSKYEEHRD